ncbi:MAG: quinone-dependent dihydroorotate dehydrogenase [Proteobacteria bacterium]|nr:quinone-dependent dihydroorotate dehydrogenase [Pseudomonadota bacterium]
MNEHREPKSNWYTSFAYPLLSHLPNREHANEVAKLGLKLFGGILADRNADQPCLSTSIWGRALSNPIGLAAGFDKDAEVFREIGKIGFGIVEIGTVTPKPQAGNPKPRVFSLEDDYAAINRMGFPSSGLDAVKRRLESRTPLPNTLLGINIGANKDSEDRTRDYVVCAMELARFADYLVCNVSSPNTPGLRNLQGKEHLSTLVRRVQDSISGKNVPLVVKIAPDVTDEDIDDIVSVGRDAKIDGLIVGNTTISRPRLTSKHKGEAGGLSGAPLAKISTEAIKKVATRVERAFPIIGCGGIRSGEDALEKLKAGASCLQLYTSLMYGGPPLVRQIKDELAGLLMDHGFASVSQAVGADFKAAYGQASV